MAVFSYIAKTNIGKTVKGTVEAPQLEGANDLLRERQLIVLKIKPVNEQDVFEKFNNFLNRVSVKDITFFARQLSVLIEASVPVVRSLRVLIKQTKNEYFKKVIADIAAEVDGGAKFSQAVNRYPHIFDQFFVHMIRSGETTGRLDKVLIYLADQKEKDYSLRSRIRGAMIYPAFIMMTMAGIGVIMMTYVVPRLTSLITESGGKIPITTQILLTTSFLIVNYWWAIILLLGLFFGGSYFYIRTEQGHYYFDLLKIRMPVFGSLYTRILLTRFSMSLANLLTSGVPVTKSLQIAGDIVNNKVYHELIEKTVAEVEAGNSIASIFIHSKYVPPIVSQMLSVGEETGRLDSILQKLANFYTQEVENAIGSLTSLIEPLILIVLGVAAGIMVTGILSPIYNISSSIG